MWSTAEIHSPSSASTLLQMHVTLFLLVTYLTAASAAPLLEPLFGWLGGLTGTNSSSPSPAAATVETQSLDELYQLAVAEGGQLIVRAGGDTSVQQDPFVQSFQERFPGINITITVDLSKVSTTTTRLLDISDTTKSTMTGSSTDH